jgi:K+-transporting ATPase ATPase C chain
MKHLKPALVLLAAFTVLLGGAYPALVTGIAAVLFPHQAGGSLVVVAGHVKGSELIGQAFADSGHFWSRPSATSPAYNAGSSSGSNLGPSNPALDSAVRSRVAALRALDPGNTRPVPVDLVTTSASGLDPHISPAAAEYQASRVARARHLGAERVRQLIARHTDGRTFGFLGEPRVNVLLLNLALDSLGGIR